MCLNSSRNQETRNEHWRGFKGWEIIRNRQSERENSIWEGKFNWSGRWEKRIEESARSVSGAKHSYSRLTTPVPQLTGEALVISEYHGTLAFSSEKKGALLIPIAVHQNIDISKRQHLVTVGHCLPSWVGHVKGSHELHRDEHGRYRVVPEDDKV